VLLSLQHLQLVDEIMAVALFSMVGLGSVLNLVGRREDDQLIRATSYRHESAVAPSLLKRALYSLVKHDHLQCSGVFSMTP
jgi:hypothetical protein